VFVKKVIERPSKYYGRWILESLGGLIKGLYLDDILAEHICHLSDVDSPTDAVIQRLFKESEKAIKQHRLYPRAAHHKAHQVNSDGGVNWEEQARTSLFRSKRCKALAQLLRMRKTFTNCGLIAGTKEELQKAIVSSAFRESLGQLVRKVKAEHVGIDMMDIVVCGAVSPYNVLLGGKLVCMLLCSPEVVGFYTRRYKKQISVIASSMKGSAVIRRPHLVLLSTTSLYGVGSSQYNRVRIPCDGIGGTAGEQIEYLRLGSSKGFGTYHLSSVTTEIAERLVERRTSGRQVNSIFGEGANPRMRKLREAFDRVGLPSDDMLRHGNPRVIYGVTLARNFREILLGFDKTPSYYLPASDEKKQSSYICEYWRKRWLLGRIRRAEILQEVSRHTLSYPMKHGARVPMQNKEEGEYLFPEFR
jgi:hypothetical protein